ncbi:MAG: hypothetical protein U9O64_09120 [Campylobacterota bacterium]|nr:hypothetical protein [Campylobacterota bacterium]
MKKKNMSLVKFTVVAAMIGFFSPSVSVNTDLQTENSFANEFSQFSISFLHTAEAKPPARGGGGNRNVNRNVNRNTNVNRNVNVNHYHSGGRHYGHYNGRAIVAWTAGLAMGAMIASSSMPSSCTTVIANNISYRRCGSAYYRPYYQGSTVVYQVVASPY